MTIDEAIEIKTRSAQEYLPVDPVKLAEADRMSIEALKRILLGRTGVQRFAHSPLPGETKD